MSYHDPVLLHESVEGLAINPQGVYVDATFGGGGHSRAILERLPQGKLFAFDQDSDAAANAAIFDKEEFTFIPANFRYMKKYLRLNGVNNVDGILADLGISSHQIDVPERGFSTRFQAQLDMRMDQQGNQTAGDIINTYDETALQRVLGTYGEVKNARTLAAAIVQARDQNPIKTVDQLKQVIKPLAPRHREYKYFAQVFQALRIEVNDELGALEDLLVQCEQLIKVGGRLVVISYHSLEDRLVKRYINKGNLKGELEKDFFGNVQRPFEPVNRKVITASEAEVDQNPRARSAKLRIGVRTTWQKK